MPDPLRDVPQDCVELIKSFEGIPDGDPGTVLIDAYLCPAGVWTIGWGHAIRDPRGQFLRGPANRAAARAAYPGGITREQAEVMLKADLLDFARDVSRLVKVPLDDGQYGALVSFAFNLGVGNLGSSTLLRLLNAGDSAGAAEQFLRWNKSNGQELAGLTRRRTAERAMFLGQPWRTPLTRGAAPMPAEAFEPLPIADSPDKPQRRRSALVPAAPRSRGGSRSTAKTSAKASPAKKASRRASAKAAPSKPLKKAPVKRAAVKRAAVKRAAAKPAVAETSVARKATAKKAPAKKAAQKRAAATKTAAKKAAGVRRR